MLVSWRVDFHRFHHFWPPFVSLVFTSIPGYLSCDSSTLLSFHALSFQYHRSCLVVLNRRNTRIIITKLPEFTNLPRLLGKFQELMVSKKRIGHLRCMEWKAPITNHLLITMKFQGLSVGGICFCVYWDYLPVRGLAPKLRHPKPMWVVLLGVLLSSGGLTLGFP